MHSLGNTSIENESKWIIFKRSGRFLFVQKHRNRLLLKSIDPKQDLCSGQKNILENTIETNILTNSRHYEKHSKRMDRWNKRKTQCINHHTDSL